MCSEIVVYKPVKSTSTGFSLLTTEIMKSAKPELHFNQSGDFVDWEPMPRQRDRSAPSIYATRLLNCTAIPYNLPLLANLLFLHRDFP